jgi:hypothetical protein
VSPINTDDWTVKQGPPTTGEYFVILRMNEVTLASEFYLQLVNLVCSRTGKTADDLMKVEMPEYDRLVERVYKPLQTWAKMRGTSIRSAKDVVKS